jgi:hypothetical protein
MCHSVTTVIVRHFIKRDRRYLLDNLPKGTVIDPQLDWSVAITNREPLSNSDNYAWLEKNLNAFVNYCARASGSGTRRRALDPSSWKSSQGPTLGAPSLGSAWENSARLGKPPRIVITMPVGGAPPHSRRASVMALRFASITLVIA